MRSAESDQRPAASIIGVPPSERQVRSLLMLLLLLLATQKLTCWRSLWRRWRRNEASWVVERCLNLRRSRALKSERPIEKLSTDLLALK